MEHGEFNKLMTQHEMGQAYKAITEKMGPSPQLIAFVNYDKVNAGEFGLESFSILDQHTQILTDIDNDPSLNMAMEGLGTTLKKIAGGYFVLNGVVALPFFPPAGVISLAIGALFIKSAMNDAELPTFKRFSDLTREFDKKFQALSTIKSAIPTSADPKAWDAFSKRVDQLTDSFPEAPDSTEVSFSKSGWDVGKFQSAVKWQKASVDKLEDVDKAAGAKFASIEKLLESKDVTPETAKKISEISSNYIDVAHGIKEVLTETKSIVTKASKHFESAKKEADKE